MKQRISILFILVALMAALLTGCSLGETTADVLPAVNTAVAEAVADAVAQLPTAAPQANVELVGQTQPEATEAAPAEAQPEVIAPIEVDPTTQEQLFIDLYNRVNPGVVSVYMTSGSGSGFIIDADGYIVTNHHVIAEGGEINVLFHNGDIKTAELVGADSQADLALLKVDAAPGELTALPLGDSDALQVGQFVIAIGSPYGLDNSMSTGIVSGLNRGMPVDELGLTTTYQIPDVIQTDAAINPGNSGGPLLNMDGEVIGVNTAIESPVRANSGVGFAVPSNVVEVVVAQLRSGGEVRYPWLGIEGGTLTPTAAEELGLPRETRGVLVSGVTAGGPAEAAGLVGIDPTTGEAGDVITGIDSVTVVEFDDLLGYIVQDTQVGQTVTLTILRDGQTQTLSLTLGERPDAVELQQQQLPQQLP
jgi:2-alkenal reductase